MNLAGTVCWPGFCIGVVMKGKSLAQSEITKRLGIILGVK